VFGAVFLLRLNSKKCYKRWDTEMRKTYGKFAKFADATTVAATGISQATTVDGMSQTTGGDTTGATNTGDKNEFYYENNN
ncbi:unnamed protein product, partial [Cercopithifilaria johnstoni]